MNNYLRRVRPAENVGRSFLAMSTKEKKYIKHLILDCNLAIELNQPYQNILHLDRVRNTGTMKKVIETLSKMKKEEFIKLINIIE